MEDLTDSAKNTFQGDLVREKIKDIIELKLKDKEYDERTVPQLVNEVTEAVMEELFASRKPYKYLVTTVIQQRTGSSVQSSTSCFWDSSTDESTFVVWPNRDNFKSVNINYPLVCIVTVFAVSFVVGL